MRWRRSSVPPQAQIAAEHEVRRLRALLNERTRERDALASELDDLHERLNHGNLGGETEEIRAWCGRVLEESA